MQKYEKIKSVGTIAIDSLKIRFPLSLVNITSKKFDEYLKVNVLTGEYDEQVYKETALPHQLDGVKTRFAIEKQPSKTGEIIEYLTIGINSRVLRSKSYFDGITKDNIHLVYDYLMTIEDKGAKIFNIEFLDFLKGDCTDVDWKRDFYYTEGQEQFFKLIDKLIILTKRSPIVDKGIKPYKNKGEQGAKWSYRRTTNWRTSPYIKIYRKILEFKNKASSREFYNKFIEPLNLDLDWLIRTEATIKNRQHFLSFGIENTSLGSILEIDDKTKSKFISKAFDKHLEGRLVKTSKTPGISTPAITRALSLVNMLMQLGMPFEQIKENIVALHDGKKKYREELFWDDLLRHHILKTDLYKDTKYNHEFIKNLGVEL